MKQEICVVAERLDRKRGGAEAYQADLVEYLAREGYAVRVYLLRPCPDPPPVPIEVIPSWQGPRLLREWYFARDLRRHFPWDHPIVLSSLPLPGITHYQPLMGLYRDAFAAARASRSPGLRRRLAGAGNRLNAKRHWLLKRQEQLLTRAPHPGIMTFSMALRNQIIAEYHTPPAAVIALPPGVDINRFCPGDESIRRRSAPEADGLKLLFTGHNFRLKGLHCLLQAMAAAVRRGLRADLLIAGNGPRAAYEDLAGRLGLASRVRFLGLAGEAEMGDLYRACDVLVHPTFIDHYSLVVPEALACGCPVITTRQNGAAELIESGKQGIILEHPRRLEAFADALLALRDRRKLAEMSEAALALRPRLDFTVHARRVLHWLTAEVDTRGLEH